MDHLIDDEELPRHERELTLSTGSILGIFLGLAVLCGAFFGFGYNMGRKSAPTPLSLSETTTDATLTGPSGLAKPPAGSPIEGTTDGTTAPVVVPASKPVHRVPIAPPSAVDGDTAASSEPVTRTAATKPATLVTPAAPIVRQPAPVSPSALSSTAPVTTGSFMVQVAAVSHQEDANLLLGALRARGYTVTTRSAAGDSFIHVQVGPFRDKKEADAMRQRLLTDGYNAIVKQ